MENFCGKTIHASVSDTVPKKLTLTTLAPGKIVQCSNPGDLERFLTLSDRLLMDQLSPHSFFVEIIKEDFGELGFIIHCLGRFLLDPFW